MLKRFAAGPCTIHDEGDWESSSMTGGPCSIVTYHVLSLGFKFIHPMPWTVVTWLTS